MPEEQNRVVADHLSALLFCPTDAAVANLAAEGIAEGVVQVGDVMLDASRLFAPAAAARPGAGGPRPGARGLPARDRAPRRGHRHAGGPRGARRPADLDRRADGLPGAPAHPPPPRGGRHVGPPRRARAAAPDPAGRLPRLHGAARGGARGHDRLGRRAEGGLLPRGPVPHAARDHRVGRDGRGRLQPPGRHGPRAGAGRPGGPGDAGGAAARTTATGRPPSGSPTPSPRGTPVARRP